MQFTDRKSREDQSMPVQLKSTYVFMFTATVIFAVYAWWVFGVVGVAHFTGPDSLVRIGQTIGSLILIGYAFEIIVLFAVGIFGIKVLKQKKEDFTLDERDKQIAYKALHLSHVVLCAGIFLSIGAMAAGWSAFWVFNLMVLSFLFSVVAELATKLFLYHRES